HRGARKGVTKRTTAHQPRARNGASPGQRGMTGGDNPASPGTQLADGQLARNGATETALAAEPNRGRGFPIGDAGRWKLDLLIREFARLINSEVALLCQVRNKLQPPTIIASWGLQATREEIRRLEETGLVGRALPLRRP